jgi:hypothetical protein
MKKQSKEVIQEFAQLKAFLKVAKFEIFKLKNLLKNKQITRGDYIKKIVPIKSKLMNYKNNMLTNYGYLQYQVDPAHAGQTISKVLGMIS